MRKLIASLTLLLACLPLTLHATDTEQANPCLDCHETDPAQFAQTVHGLIECLDCHVGADSRRHRRGLDPVNCGGCHAEILAEHAVSVHGVDGKRHSEGMELPSCTSCHGDTHTMMAVTDPSSPMNEHRQGETCGSCHGAGQPAPAGVRTIRPIAAYTASVHAAEVDRGNHGASCSDCHTAHSPLQAADPESSIYRLNVPATCGACHAEITALFDNSIHGLAAYNGVADSPVCTDCHGEHRILGVTAAGSPVSATNIPIQVCGPCHSDVRLGEKYGLAADQVPSYEDSYHGLAARGGVLEVANCASCHGVHNILPSRDPASHTHPDNLAETCGKCHVGAGSRFAIAPVHTEEDHTLNIVAHWIRLIYIPLIWVTVLGMLLHNLLDLGKKTRTYSLWRRRPRKQDAVSYTHLTLPTITE